MTTPPRSEFQFSSTFVSVTSGGGENRPPHYRIQILPINNHGRHTFPIDMQSIAEQLDASLQAKTPNDLKPHVVIQPIRNSPYLNILIPKDAHAALNAMPDIAHFDATSRKAYLEQIGQNPTLTVNGATNVVSLHARSKAPNR